MSEMTTLNSVCKVIYRYPQFYGMDKHETGVPVLRGEHLLKNKRISNDWSEFWFVDEVFSKKFPKTVLENGDVVMSVRGSVGKIGLVEHQHAGAQISPNLIRISPNGEIIDKKFAFFAIDWATDHFVARNSQAQALPSLSASNIKNMEIFCPPLAEQERIVEILSDADAAIATAERLLASSQKKSDGIRGKCFENLYSVSEQALVTEHFDFVNGMAFKPSDWSQDGLPIIRIQNLTNPRAEYNYFAGKTDEKYLVENGDFLLSWSATLGCFIWDGPKALLNQHIFKVLPRQENSIEFGYHLMRHFLHLMKGKVHGSSMKHITKKDLNTIKMPIPSPEKQCEVAQALDIVEAEIRTQHIRVLALEKQKRGLMQQLLTGKLRVPEKGQ